MFCPMRPRSQSECLFSHVRSQTQTMCMSQVCYQGPSPLLTRTYCPPTSSAHSAPRARRTPVASVRAAKAASVEASKVTRCS